LKVKPVSVALQTTFTVTAVAVLVQDCGRGATARWHWDGRPGLVLGGGQVLRQK